MADGIRCSHGKFLSTPSARRATDEYGCNGSSQNISIHALREEGDKRSLCCAVFYLISIHALREEGDPDAALSAAKLFSISIHALREEGDGIMPSAPSIKPYFYPRPPRGGRHPAVE